MSLKSHSAKSYTRKLVTITIICLCAYYVYVWVAFQGKDMFDVTEANRMSVLLGLAAVIGWCAYEMRPSHRRRDSDGHSRRRGMDELAADEDGNVDGDAAPPTGLSPSPPPPPPEEKRIGAQEVHAEMPSAEQPMPADPSPDDPESCWQAARAMPHSFIPDRDFDADYLRLVRMAARGGISRAQLKLGEYAMRRGALVEAFYWYTQAELAGDRTAARSIAECVLAWKNSGCPLEYELVNPDFDGTAAAFSRAALRFRAGVDFRYAHGRLKEMANDGNELAGSFLQMHRRG